MDLHERIIECVREHNCLYDPSNKNYKNASFKARHWQSIAEQLNETSETVKTKWKGMRDGYIKYKKQLKAAAGSEKKVASFMWSDQLSFLDDTHLREPKCEDSKSPNYANVDALPSLLLPATSSNSIPISSLSKASLRPTTSLRRTNKRSADTCVDSLIVDNFSDGKEKSGYDSIDYLFCSYAQTFKKFSRRKQAMLKVDLAKLFAEAELSEINTSEDIPQQLPSNNIHTPISLVSVSYSDNEPSYSGDI